MSDPLRVGFVGGGKMGGGMIGGLLAHAVAAPDAITVCEPVAATRAALAEKYGVRVTTDYAEAVAGAAVVVLAVKPQDFPTAAAGLRPVWDAAALPVSIMAGVPLARITDTLGVARAVRVMPNLGATVGESFSTWTATAAVTDADRAAVRALLGAAGREQEVGGERYLDMATAVAGSGPGYLLLVIEALIDGAVHIGLPRPLATDMVMQTVLGTIRWAQATGGHPAELRAQVVSPGGTTAAGLLALEQGGTRAALVEAIIAAHEKSRMLGQ